MEDEAYWIPTIEILSTIFSKPKLSDKHLTKPPFRFLHDIIMAVMRATGFGDGLYSEEETDSRAFNSKEEKIMFLERILNYTAFAVNSFIPMRPEKVVIGKEPEITNYFLQLLGQAALHPDVNREECLARVLSGETQNEDLGQEFMDGKEDISEPEPPRPSSSVNRHRPQIEETTSQFISSPSEHEDQLRQSESGHARDRYEKESTSVRQDARMEQTSAHEVDKAERSQRRPPRSDSAGSRGTTDASATGSLSHRESNPPQETSSRETYNRSDTGSSRGSNRSGSAGRTSSAKSDSRPLTAGRRPPPVHQNERPISGPRARPGSGSERPAVIGVIRDGDDDDPSVYDVSIETVSAQVDAHENEESGSMLPGSSGASASIRRQRTREFTFNKEAVSKEVSMLQQSVQKLCATANPLSKTLEFLQEDLDSMSRELQSWKEESHKQETKLNDFQRQVEDDLLPLKMQYEDISQQIQDLSSKIYSTKANVLRNDAQIQRFLRLVVLPNSSGVENE